MTTKTFTTVIHKEENINVANCPEIGTVSQGESVAEAMVAKRTAFGIANLKEATELYLEEFSLAETILPVTAIWRQEDKISEKNRE